jgi:hypothetical protein
MGAREAAGVLRVWARIDRGKVSGAREVNALEVWATFPTLPTIAGLTSGVPCPAGAE